MGEYINVNGESVKLGTCEDLYYTRFDQLKELAKTNPEAREYLKPEFGFRYRFPFPDEDGEPVGGYYHKGFERGLLVQLPEPEHYHIVNDMNHYEIWHTNNINGGYNVNVQHPCPYSKEIHTITHSPIHNGLVEIVQQKQIDGELWLVIRCPYCHALARVDFDEANIIAEAVKDEEIARRIRAGYQKEHILA